MAVLCVGGDGAALAWMMNPFLELNLSPTGWHELCSAESENIESCDSRPSGRVRVQMRGSVDDAASFSRGGGGDDAGQNQTNKTHALPLQVTRG